MFEIDYDLPNNICLNMSIINIKPNDNIDDFVFIDILNTNNNNINLSNDIKILDETIKKGYVEQIICVDLNYFLQDIKNSFKNNSIKYQFEVDLPRCNVYLNKYLIKDTQKVYKFLKNKYSDKIVNNIMMLTTQALLGLPFQLIFNNIDNEQYILAEIEAKSNKKQPYRVRIDLEKESIQFKAYKELRIFEFDNNSEPINRFKVFIKLEFDIKSKENLLINIKMTKYLN